MLMNTSVDILSFDAYNYALPFSLYADDIRSFLRRGGVIAWGIVPNGADLLPGDDEMVNRLTARLLEAIGLLVQKGISRDDLLHGALITASCDLGAVPVPAAIRVCELTAGVSARMRSIVAGNQRAGS